MAKTKFIIMDDAVMDSIVSSVMELQNKENTNLPLYEKRLRDTEIGIQNMISSSRFSSGVTLNLMNCVFLGGPFF